MTSALPVLSLETHDFWDKPVAHAKLTSGEPLVVLEDVVKAFYGAQDVGYLSRSIQTHLKEVMEGAKDKDSEYQKRLQTTLPANQVTPFHPILASGETSKKTKHAVSHVFAKKYLTFYHSKAPDVQKHSEESIELDGVVRGGVLAGAGAILQRNAELRDNPTAQAAQLSGTGISVEEANTAPVLGSALGNGLGVGAVAHNTSAGGTVNVNVSPAPVPPPRSTHSSDGSDDEDTTAVVRGVRYNVSSIMRHVEPRCKSLIAQMDNLSRDDPFFNIKKKSLERSMDNAHRMEGAMIDLAVQHTEQERLDREHARKMEEIKLTHDMNEKEELRKQESERLAHEIKEKEELRKKEAEQLANEIKEKEEIRKREAAQLAYDRKREAEQLEYDRKKEAEQLEYDRAQEEKKREEEAARNLKKARDDEKDRRIERAAKRYKVACETKTLDSTMRASIANDLATHEDALGQVVCSDDWGHVLAPIERRHTALQWFKIHFDKRKASGGAFISKLRAEARKEFMASNNVSQTMKNEIGVHMQREGKTYVQTYPTSVLQTMQCFAQLNGI